jgi:hypothetical protein
VQEVAMYRKKINDVKAAVVTAILSILESATSPYIPERLLKSLDSGKLPAMSQKCFFALGPEPFTRNLDFCFSAYPTVP